MNPADFDRNLKKIETANRLLTENLEECCSQIKEIAETFLWQVESRTLPDRYLEQYKHNKKGINFMIDRWYELNDRIFYNQYDEDTIILARTLLRQLYKDFLIMLKTDEENTQKAAKSRMIYLKIGANLLKVLFQILQIITIGGAAIVPFMLNVPDIPKVIPTILSSLVAGSAALISSFKIREYAMHIQLEAEKIEQEYQTYETARGSYKGITRGEALTLFLDRLDELKQEQIRVSHFLIRSMIKQNKHKDQGDDKT